MEARRPLTAAMFNILFAPANGDKHGYEIMDQVRRDTRGAVKMGMAAKGSRRQSIRDTATW